MCPLFWFHTLARSGASEHPRCALAAAPRCRAPSPRVLSLSLPCGRCLLAAYAKPLAPRCTREAPPLPLPLHGREQHFCRLQLHIICDHTTHRQRESWRSRTTHSTTSCECGIKGQAGVRFMFPVGSGNCRSGKNLTSKWQAACSSSKTSRLAAHSVTCMLDAYVPAMSISPRPIY